MAGPSGGWFRSPVRHGKGTLDRHHIERAVEASLRRLGTDHIDLYQTHWPDRRVPIDETLRGLENVVASGKVRYVGCSNETAHGLTRALDCEMSLTTFATAWTLTRDFVGSTIVGATKVEQLDDLLAAAEVTLPPEALEACDRITREIPYPMG